MRGFFIYAIAIFTNLCHTLQKCTIFVHMEEIEVQKRKSTTTRTKDLLIEVARQLFARFGVEKTTMNDIAEASKRGRRTVYMYFKNKMDVFYAVVSRELDHLYERLKAVALSDLPSEEKLLKLIATHMKSIYQLVMRNGSLKADFFNDIRRVERVRYKFDVEERKIIAHILQEGCAKGNFSIADIEPMALLIQGSIKGLEVPYINRQTHRMEEEEFERLFKAIKQLLFSGLQRDRTSGQKNILDIK